MGSVPYPIKTSSDTTYNFELCILGSEQNKAKTTRSALVFYTIDPVKDKTIYDESKKTHSYIVPCIKILDYETTGIDKEKKHLDFVTRGDLYIGSPPGKYCLSNYSLLFTNTHGYLEPFQDKDDDTPQMHFRGIALGYYDGTEKKYCPQEGGLQGTFLSSTDMGVIKANTNIDYYFVFLSACFSAENLEFDSDEPEQTQYQMATMAKDMMEGFNTHAYMGWQNAVTCYATGAFARWFFYVCAEDTTKEEPISVEDARIEALSRIKTASLRYEAKQKIKLLSPRGTDLTKFSIDLREYK